MSNILSLKELGKYDKSFEEEFEREGGKREELRSGPLDVLNNKAALIFSYGSIADGNDLKQ